MEILILQGIWPWRTSSFCPYRKYDAVRVMSAVSKAEVLYHTDENGKKLEPMETAVIDVPEEFSGVVIEKLSQRKGELRNMSMSGTGSTRLEFSIPSRGLIGYRGDFMTDTKGTGIINTLFEGYAHIRETSNTESRVP